ncbi:MAG: AI-2E family transporter [Zunongwangia sp.]|uniref:AI-2E family transporter n=1 Tax=Zunongwangia sp. TaxID=1965325 RepID=UPI003242641F
MNKLRPALVRQIFVLLLILFLGILIFRELVPYLTGILGAITLYVLMASWMQKLLKKGWKPSVAAGVLMFGSFIGILIPVSGIIIMLTSKIGKAVNNSEMVVSAIKKQLQHLEEYVGYDITGAIDTSAISGWVSEKLQNLAGGTFNVFVAVGLMYFMLYFMLINREKMKTALIDYIPLGKANLSTIAKESNLLVKSNALGIPLVAFVQGLIALIGYLVLGVPDPFFWFGITAIGSMIPFIGTAIGIAPTTILLFADGQNWQGVALLIYGIVVVGSTDNLIRIMVLDRLAKVHTLITLVGVIVGVQIFGFIGLIFGPLLVSLFLLILKIYKKEYGNENDRL